jgi:hypothetical protein
VLLHAFRFGYMRICVHLRAFACICVHLRAFACICVHLRAFAFLSDALVKAAGRVPVVACGTFGGSMEQQAAFINRMANECDAGMGVCLCR